MTTETVIITDYRPVFDVQALAAKAGLDALSAAELVAEAEEHCQARGAARISAIRPAGDGEIRLEAITFHSPLLQEKLSGLGRAFPYIVTEGQELASWAKKYAKSDKAQLVHQIRQAVVKGCEAEIEHRLEAQFGIPILSSLNPGSLKDWPLSDQKLLHELLAPLPKEIGVTLLPSGIMAPDYTVSGIFFQTDKKYYNCQLCPRDNCPNRKAPRER